MNYYKRHLGDYAKDTNGLTMTEHGAFTLLLDRYYASEQPFDKEDAMRVCRPASPAEAKAVEYVLRKFFTLDDAGMYRNDRADAEIQKAQTKAEVNREVGKKGGRPAKSGNPKETQTVLKQNPDENPEGTQDEPIGNPSHYSTTPRKKRTPVVPESGDVVQQVLSAYHEVLPNCRHHFTVTPSLDRRIRKVNAMAQAVTKQQGWGMGPVEFWTAYFGECSADAWLRGDVPNPNNPSWKQHLACLIHDDRFQTIMDTAIARVGAEQQVAA